VGAPVDCARGEEGRVMNWQSLAWREKAEQSKVGDGLYCKLFGEPAGCVAANGPCDSCMCAMRMTDEALEADIARLNVAEAKA